MNFYRYLVWIGLMFVLVSSFTYSEPDSPNGLIILMTDLGTKDFYVGAIKGAIYNISPQARIDSISHDISQIKEGAYTLVKAASIFPQGTVFIAVVGIEIGTDYKPIALKTTNGNYFVAPDNGVLTLVGREMGVAEVREITNSEVIRQEVQTRTLYGHNIFAPAARLANDFPFEKVGPVLKSYVQIPSSEFPKIVNGEINGRIDDIDENGNIITNIRADLFIELQIQTGQTVEVEFEGSHKRPIRCKYVKTSRNVKAGEFCGWFANTVFFEIGIRQGNIAEVLNLTVPGKVIIRKMSK